MGAGPIIYSISLFHLHHYRFLFPKYISFKLKTLSFPVIIKSLLLPKTSSRVVRKSEINVYCNNESIFYLHWDPCVTVSFCSGAVVCLTFGDAEVIAAATAFTKAQT